MNNTNNWYGKVEQFTLVVYEIDSALIELRNTKPDLKTIIPPEHHKYLRICKKVNSNTLPFSLSLEL
jgi:hypothetical protein